MLARVHVTGLGFLEVRGDIDRAARHQRQRARSRLDKVAHAHLAIGDDAIDWRSDDGVAQILSGKCQRGAGMGFAGDGAGERGGQIGAGCPGDGGLALRHQQFGPGTRAGLLCANGRCARRLCIARGHGATGQQCAIAAVIGLGMAGIGLACTDCGRCGRNLRQCERFLIALPCQRCARHRHRRLRVGQIGLRAVIPGGKFLRIDAQQGLPSPDWLVFPNKHRADEAFHTGRDRRRIRGEIGIVGGLIGRFSEYPCRAQGQGNQCTAPRDRSTANTRVP